MAGFLRGLQLRRASAFFGNAVEICGNTVLVGASGVDGPNATGFPWFNGGLGQAYVFTRSGTSWSRQATLDPDGTSQSTYYGFSLALDGSNAISLKSKKDGLQFFDVPTTLRGCSEAIRLLLPNMGAVGKSREQEIVEKREIENFAETLQHVIATDSDGQHLKDRIKLKFW